jgi:release factor glutamine methyltransferase
MKDEAATHSRIDTVAERLRAAGCIAADEEAEELSAAAPDSDTLESWTRRRERGEPLAWITGAARFCDRTLRIDPGVFVPRARSEELARRASALLPVGGRAVDLCTGSGAIASYLMSETRAASVVGVDIDVRAALCARRNGVRVLRSDLDGSLRSESFDMVTAVAPYVPTEELHLLPGDYRHYETSLALDGGRDGLDTVRRIVLAAARLLRPGGWLFVELGGSQDEALAPALAVSGFDPAEPWFDEDGDLRGVCVQTRSSAAHRLRRPRGA